jgi:hypothetical protein
MKLKITRFRATRVPKPLNGTPEITQYTPKTGIINKLSIERVRPIVEIIFRGL